jgi:hypothetical protein
VTGGRGARLLALWWLVAPLAAVVAYRSVARFDFVADARFLILDNQLIRGMGQLFPNLSHDYFWSSSGNQIPYWRPVTKGSWVLERLAFGDWAGGFLLVQLGWHVLGVLGVQILGRWMGLSRGSALVAGLVLALHPAAIEPVAMIMARSDVVAASSVVGSVIGWLAWRRTGRLGWAALHVIAAATAVGSKEQAAFLPALLALRVLIEGGFARERWRAFLPVVPAAVVVAGYLLVRQAVLAAAGMPGGALAIDPVRIAGGLSLYLTNTWPLALSSSVRDVSLAEARSGGFLLRAAVVAAVALAVGISSHRRRDADALTLLAWALLALSPVLLTRDIFVPTEQAKYSLADRWLLHALAPATLLWLHLARQLGASAERVVLAAGTGWGLVMLAGATPARAEFATEAAMLGNEDRVFYLAVPPQYRTPEDRCRYKQRKVVRASFRGDHAAIPDLSRDAMAACGDRPEIAVELLRALVASNRLDEAEPIARRLAEHPPVDRRSHAELARLVGIVLANRKAQPGAGASPPAVDCRSFIARAEAARAAGDIKEAVAQIDHAFTCGGERDSSLLVAAATWLVASGDGAAARAVLRRLEGRTLGEDQSAQVAALDRAIKGEPSTVVPPAAAGR